MFRFFLFFLVIFYSVECYSSDINAFLTEEEQLQLDDILSTNPQNIYDLAIENIRNKKYYDAIDDLSKIELYYSHSSFYFKVRLLIPYVYMLNKQYSLATSSINLFLSLYPEYEDIDFIYYLRGEIYYNHALYQSFGKRFSSNKNINISSSYIDAVDSFKELIKNYPNSKYSALSKEKIVQINDLIVNSKLGLARYYQRDKKSLAALKILYSLTDNYSDSKFMPEVMFRIIEIYYQWGLDLEVKNISDNMKNNYPDNIWTDRILDNFLKKNIKFNNEDDIDLII